jgi:hypothetical protein
LKGTDSQSSPYYPPRAHWYSSLWRWWYPFKRRLYLEKLPRLGQHEIGRTLLGLVLPGWALLWSTRPMWGVVLGMAYCAAVPVFLIWRGYPASNIALMLMITIHAGSVLRIEQSDALWKRCFWSLVVFLALGGMVYTPLVNLMERHWFVALRVGDRVIRIRTGVKSEKIRRGDWIAYRIGELGFRHGYETPLRVQGGCTLGRVMAVAGDEIAFTSQNLLINGEVFPLLSRMPTNGTFQVEQRHWFIWPEMTVGGELHLEQSIISETMMTLANVPETSYVGIPYHRWFGRQQTVP